MKKILTILSLAALTIGLLGSCKKDEPKKPAETYIVHFDKNGHGYQDQVIPDMTVESGSTITKPADPADSTLSFDGWFKADSSAWDFANDKVTANTTLFAHWNTTTPASGEGTSEKPYVVYNRADLERLLGSMKQNTSTFFELGGDIDLGGKKWTPIDCKTPKQILVFNGKKHSLKNLWIEEENKENIGFIGDLYKGTIHDLKVEGANIKVASAKKIGIIAGCARDGSDIYNCYVQGTITHTNGITAENKGDLNLGGVVGQQLLCGVHECESNVIINITGTDQQVSIPTGWVGGISGGFGKDDLTISNCISRGKFTTTSGIVLNFGGILGYSKNSCSDSKAKGHTIKNCISFVKMDCTAQAGGIVGLLNGDSNSGVNDSKSVVNGCIAWNEAITVSSTDSTNFKRPSGAIVAMGGYCGYNNNYRKSDLIFSCKFGPEGTEAWPLSAFNDDCEAGTEQKGADGKIAPHNGHVAEAGKTASQIASAIGWDVTIWDLSEAEPALKCFKK